MNSVNFRELYCSDKYYSVGVDADTGAPIIQITVTSVAWRDYFFRLTLDEFAAFQANHNALDDLADRMAYDKGRKYFADRLIA